MASIGCNSIVTFTFRQQQTPGLPEVFARADD
jgi:hypothetical protein